jgi:hypothetical protein
MAGAGNDAPPTPAGLAAGVLAEREGKRERGREREGQREGGGREGGRDKNGEGFLVSYELYYNMRKEKTPLPL